MAALRRRFHTYNKEYYYNRVGRWPHVDKTEVAKRTCALCDSSHTRTKINHKKRLDGTARQIYRLWYKSKEKAGEWWCSNCYQKLLVRRLKRERGLKVRKKRGRPPIQRRQL